MIGDCAALPLDAGHPARLAEMATQPAGSAIATNLGMPSMSYALNRNGLREELDEAASLTIIIPSEVAFGSMPDALYDSPEEMKKLIERHVLRERLDPQQLLGTHRSIAGSDITATADGGRLTLNGRATVLCGNIVTTNATIYVIDSML
ncbi:fasciclin domain-containing protein [Actinoplanes sp. NPDC023714]|uniref:fasciclin domain-containing protein n=1 Tax=Actinoplanes sp. NPDC023714 TaxID=3154322 RepID=UPI0033EAA527